MAVVAYPYGISSGGVRGTQRDRHLRLVTDEPFVTGVARRPARTPARSSARSPLRRALPLAVTLGVLASVWFGAGALASAGGPSYVRLPGSVPVAGGFAYVVRPGDTVWSIASRLDPSGDVGPLVNQLESELGPRPLTAGSVLTVP